MVLASALGNEHFEIASYENLIIPVRAMGVSDAVKLLIAALPVIWRMWSERRRARRGVAG